jgi:hypothetical protein
MYCQEIINNNLEKIQPTFIWKGKTYKFKLHEYSSIEIDRAIDALNNYINLPLYLETRMQSGNKCKIYLKNEDRPLTNDDLPKDAIQFITNERIFNTLSCWHFMENYYLISDITNTFVKYKPTKPQLVWKNIAGKLEKQGRAIRELRGKARQTTSSTDAQGKILQRLITIPDVKSMIASYEDKPSMILSQMILDAYERLPYWAKPKISNFETGSYFKFENGSLLNISYGTREMLTTGTTPTVSLCSEISKYKYPEQSIEASLIRSMHESENLLQIFESTADGDDDDNYFKKKWNETIKSMESGTTSLYASFVPWPMRDDIYPTKTWLRGRSSAFEKYTPSIEILQYAKKIENYIKGNPDLREVMGSNWVMPKEQMFFYEISRDEADRDGTLYLFLQEMPGTPEEMFQNSARPIYSIQIIEHHEANCYEKIPEVYKARGPEVEIDPQFWPQPDEIMDNGKIIQIKPKWAEFVKSEYELVQIKFNGWHNFAPNNKFLIWEHPKFNERYGAGLDNSDGLGEKLSDNAAIQGLKAGTIKTKDEQVFEFVSPDLNPARIWPFLYLIGTYYSPEEQCLLVIELNKGGIEAQNNIVQRGWSNLHKIIDPTQLGKDNSNVLKYGFETNTRTRILLQNFFNQFFIGKHVNIRSLKLMQEIRNLKKKLRLDGNLKLHGSSDNRWLAFMIILYCLHEDEILGFQKAGWEERIKAESNEIIVHTFNQNNYFKDNRSFKIEDIKSGKTDFDYDSDDRDGVFEVEML